MQWNLDCETAKCTEFYSAFRCQKANKLNTTAEFCKPKKAAMSINSWWNKSACITNNKPFAVRGAVRYGTRCATLIIIHFLLLWFIYSYFHIRHAPICKCMMWYRVHSLWFGQILTRFSCVQRRRRRRRWRRHVFSWTFSTITNEISKSCLQFGKKVNRPKDWRRSLRSTDPQMKINVLSSQDFRNFSCSSWVASTVHHGPICHKNHRPLTAFFCSHFSEPKEKSESIVYYVVA